MANTEPYRNLEEQLLRKMLPDPPRPLSAQEQDLIRRMRAQEHPVVYSPAHLEAAQRHTYREAPPRVPTPPSPPTASEQLAALLASPKRSLTALQTLALHHQDALTPEERVLLLDALMEPAPEPAPEPQPEYKQITATEQWAALDKARTYQDVLQPDLSKAWQQQQEQQQRVLQRQMELQKQMEDHQRRAMTRNATLGLNEPRPYTDIIDIPGAKLW